MKKQIKRIKFLFYLGIIGFIGFLGYKLVLQPTIYNNPETLVVDFIDNMNASATCDSHFNPETKTLCTLFQENLNGETVTISAMSASGDIVIADLQVNGNVVRFTFHLLTEETGGARGFIHKESYLIDTIE